MSLNPIMMQAVVLSPPNTTKVQSLPTPRPRADELLIRVHAVALNPVDALYVAHPIAENTDGRVVGSDFAGEVVGMGPAVIGWQIGDRAAAFLQGACSTNDRPGAFAEYATTPFDLAIHIPAEVSYEEASSVPLCGLTAAQALFERLTLPAPFPISLSQPVVTVSSNQALLIYGASTVLGLFTLSLALQVPNLRIYGTASPSNHAMLLSRGIHGIANYRDPTWVDQIRDMAKKDGVKIGLGVDCISEGETTGKISYSFDGKGKIAVVRLTAWDSASVKSGVEVEYGAVWTGLGETVGYNGSTLPARPQSRAFASSFYAWLSTGSRQNSAKLPIQVPPIRSMPGGLDSIHAEGFKLLGSGKIDERPSSVERTEDWMKPISAEKLVYNLV